jgi:hypothetical protein
VLIARLAIFAILLAACGARTDLGGGHGDAATSVTELEGVVVNDCAPNDGPATAFALALPGATVIPSCPSTVVSALSVRISFWAPEIPKAPGTFTIGDGSFKSGSMATVCPFKGPCVAADHGTLTVTAFDATSASGFFTLAMPDQTTMTGNFTAISVCHNFAGCG